MCEPGTKDGWLQGDKSADGSAFLQRALASRPLAFSWTSTDSELVLSTTTLTCLLRPTKRHLVYHRDGRFSIPLTLHHTLLSITTPAMADAMEVDPAAAPAEPKAKKPIVKKGGKDGKGSGKKFEVKKVGHCLLVPSISRSLGLNPYIALR